MTCFCSLVNQPVFSESGKKRAGSRDYCLLNYLSSSSHVQGMVNTVVSQSVCVYVCLCVCVCLHECLRLYIPIVYVGMVVSCGRLFT